MVSLVAYKSLSSRMLNFRMVLFNEYDFLGDVNSTDASLDSLRAFLELNYIFLWSLYLV